MVTCPSSYSCLPTGNRSRVDGSPSTGGATHFAVTSCTVEPAQLPLICQTSMVPLCGTGAVNVITGPLPSPVLTPLVKTMISEPTTKSVRTTCVSPSWTGSTWGAGKAEQG